MQNRKDAKSVKLGKSCGFGGSSWDLRTFKMQLLALYGERMFLNNFKLSKLLLKMQVARDLKTPTKSYNKTN